MQWKEKINSRKLLSDLYTLTTACTWMDTHQVNENVMKR